MKVLFKIVIVMFVAAGGCKYKTAWNEMKLVSYRDSDSPREIIQNFEEGSYSTGSSDQYDIMLENHEPFSHNGKRILFQSLNIRIIWNPIPGRTYAESSQINAHIDYTIKIEDAPYSSVTTAGGYATLNYHGSGFVSITENKSKTKMKGAIEHAVLNPDKDNTGDSLGRFILSGKFRAVRR